MAGVNAFIIGGSMDYDDMETMDDAERDEAYQHLVEQAEFMMDSQMEGN